MSKAFEKVIEDAKKRASETIAEANSKAAQIISNAEKEWLKKLESKRHELLEKARRESEIMLSEARRRAKLIIIDARNKAIEEAFKEAEKDLANIDKRKSIAALLKEALSYATKPVKIYASPRDGELIEEVARVLGLNDVVIVKSDDIDGGVVVEDESGVKIDNTYRTRMKRSMEVLVKEVAKVLQIE
ncbi:MAG: V-type ATP synthase subunit E family protein [Sulfolobales archaeon]|nr:V-type ATP synthase subunit E family protein [Sulfolobales archaeon]